MGSDRRWRKLLVPGFSASHPFVSLCSSVHSCSPLNTCYLVRELFLSTGYIVCHFSETVENFCLYFVFFFFAQVPSQAVFICLLLIIIFSFYFSVQRP